VLVVASIAVAAWPSGGKAAPHHRAASLGARTEVAPPSTVASTTVATPVVTAVNTGATEATYAANTSTVRLTVAVVNPCWIELRSTSAAGPVVYEGVLQSGASQTFQELRGLWLRIGNPAGVAVHVDGQRVNLPSGSNPYNVSVTTGA
jgi:hypothetical protein